MGKAKKGKDIALKSYEIELKDVTFAYDSRSILDGINLKIPKNSTCAIVGPSGSGKTTLCNIIARFWDVKSGSVKIGGHDVREFTCDSLLSYVSMVFQKVYLFNDTIENNIKFGKPNASHAEVVAAAKRACCHDFIEALPQGYETMIGEAGSTLSGGEKQRISIARAILKDAPIIILDEATSSVDPENEKALLDAIFELTKNKTLISIAHRLSTVRTGHCDSNSYYFAVSPISKTGCDLYKAGNENEGCGIIFLASVKSSSADIRRLFNSYTYATFDDSN